MFIVGCAKGRGRDIRVGALPPGVHRVSVPAQIVADGRKDRWRAPTRAPGLIVECAEC